MAKPKFKKTRRQSAANEAFAAAQALQIAEKRGSGKSTLSLKLMQEDATARANEQAELRRIAGAVIEQATGLRAPCDFWLVQRIEPRTRSNPGLLGSKFELDYMGSAEFEYGRPQESIRRMRSLGDIELQAVHLTRKGVTRTVFCVAPAVGMADKLTDFVRWASQDYPRAKERTKFDTVFDQDNSLGQLEYCRTVAWWSLDDDIMWSLDLEIAEQLREAVERTSSKA